MSLNDDLTAEVAAITTDFNAYKDAVTQASAAQAQTIATLEAQIAAGGADGLTADQAQSLLTQLKGVQTTIDNAITPPAPPSA